jgi:hypothetical protein
MSRSCSGTSTSSRASRTASAESSATVSCSPGHRWPVRGSPPPCGINSNAPMSWFRKRSGAEGVGVVPEVRVVVLPVEVEQHHRVLGDPLAVELDVAGRPAADERRERVEPPHLVRERLREGCVAVGQPLAVVRPADQRVRRVGHEPGDRRRRPDDVEQFDRRGARFEQLSVGVPVLRDHLDRRAGVDRRGAGAHALDEPGQPRLPPLPGPPCAEVPRAAGGEAVDQGHQVAGQRRDLVVGQRDAGPPGDRTGDHLRRRVEEHDLRPRRPLRGRVVPRRRDLLHQGGDAVLAHQQRHEHRLADPVRLAVQRVHGALAEEGGLHRFR